MKVIYEGGCQTEALCHLLENPKIALKPIQVVEINGAWCIVEYAVGETIPDPGHE